MTNKRREVHKPHEHLRTLHEKLVEIAAAEKIQTLIVTFEPHAAYDYRAYITIQGKIQPILLRHQQVCTWVPEA